MKDEKILQEEQLSNEELEKVSGGTVRESWGIFQEINKKGAPAMPLSHLPDYLKKTYGIDAKIYGRPDDFEGAANEYSRNGEKLTHQQVLDIINGKL